MTITLNEAIKHAEEVAEEKLNNAINIRSKIKSETALKNAEECEKCAEEHKQLAEWLKDYKRLLEQEPKTDNWSIKDVADTLEKHGLIAEREPCEDAISREDLIQKFNDDVFIRDKTDSKEDYQQVFASTVLAVIKSLPSVTPKRKVGEWKKNERTFWTCSECGLVNKYNRVQYAYCPNCGAKMQGGQK